MEENRTPSLFNCPLLFRVRKVRSESVISGSLFGVPVALETQKERSGTSQEPKSASIYYDMMMMIMVIEVPDVERNVDPPIKHICFRIVFHSAKNTVYIYII